MSEISTQLTGGLGASPATPTLGAAKVRPFAEYSAAELWHLLSLDAPTIAVLWTVFLAQCTRVRLGWSLPTSLFLAVWMLYASDRLLDARPLAGSLPSEQAAADLLERHHFHRRYHRAFLVVILGCGLILFVLLPTINRTTLGLYAVEGALLAGWLLLVHSRRALLTGRKSLPKELAVGVFFPAAIFLPTLAQAPALGWELLPFALLFAAVCSLNCLFLYAWEHAGEPLHAHVTTRWAVGHLRSLALGTMAVSLLVCTGLRLTGGLLPLAKFALACGLAALGLLLLHRRHQDFEPLSLRVAADAALLTPLLFLRLST